MAEEFNPVSGDPVEFMQDGRRMKAHILSIQAVYVVKVDGYANVYHKAKNELFPPSPSEEEAWERAAILAGRRSNAPYLAGAMWEKETRHQMYLKLVEAHIPITDEVKMEVRRLIAIAGGL